MHDPPCHDMTLLDAPFPAPARRPGRAPHAVRAEPHPGAPRHPPHASDAMTPPRSDAPTHSPQLQATSSCGPLLLNRASSRRRWAQTRCTTCWPATGPRSPRCVGALGLRNQPAGGLCWAHRILCGGFVVGPGHHLLAGYRASLTVVGARGLMKPPAGGFFAHVRVDGPHEPGRSRLAAFLDLLRSRPPPAFSTQPQPPRAGGARPAGRAQAAAGRPRRASAAGAVVPHCGGGAAAAGRARGGGNFCCGSPC